QTCSHLPLRYISLELESWSDLCLSSSLTASHHAALRLGLLLLGSSTSLGWNIALWRLLPFSAQSAFIVTLQAEKSQVFLTELRHCEDLLCPCSHLVFAFPTRQTLDLIHGPSYYGPICGASRGS
ncbi:hypothetical protein BKA70DRAFT_1579164, partial [Coprinopsis sp. MPI-PUGE-AT-0042]